jgi:hypothetical protein
MQASGWYLWLQYCQAVLVRAGGECPEDAPVLIST